jgi:biotin operon repressor
VGAAHSVHEVEPLSQTTTTSLPTLDDLLLLAQHERLSGNQIAAQMPPSRPAISHHLTVRLQGGPVQMERVSRKKRLQPAGGPRSPRDAHTGRAGGDRLHLSPVPR